MTDKDKEAIIAELERIDAEYGIGANSIHQDMNWLISFIVSLPEDELSHSVRKRNHNCKQDKMESSV